MTSDRWGSQKITGTYGPPPDGTTYTNLSVHHVLSGAEALKIERVGLHLALDDQATYRTLIAGSMLQINHNHKFLWQFPFWAFLDAGISRRLQDEAPLVVDDDPLRALSVLAEVAADTYPFEGFARSLGIRPEVVPSHSQLEIKFMLRRRAAEALQAVEQHGGFAALEAFFTGQRIMEVL